MIYLNDILIYIDDIYKEYIQYIHQILQYLFNHNLYMKFEKYEFHIQETQFLDFIIFSNNIIMNSNHIIIIIN
jgi:hypothetical protein